MTPQHHLPADIERTSLSTITASPSLIRFSIFSPFPVSSTV